MSSPEVKIIIEIDGKPVALTGEGEFKHSVDYTHSGYCVGIRDVDDPKGMCPKCVSTMSNSRVESTTWGGSICPACLVDEAISTHLYQKENPDLFGPTQDQEEEDSNG